MKIKAKWLLRIAALIMFFHGIGNTFGVLTFQNPNGGLPNEVVQKMKEVHFAFMGRDDSSMADFYLGFGFMGSVFILFIAVLLWVLSSQKEKYVSKILCVTGMALVLLTIVEAIFFFPMAVAFCLVSVVLVFVSIFLMYRVENVKK